jgi:hypothetical protein
VVFGNSSSNLVYDVDGINPARRRNNLSGAVVRWHQRQFAGTHRRGRWLRRSRAVRWHCPDNCKRPAGQLATVQVKAWETAYGTTFEQALAAGGKTGASGVFTDADRRGRKPPLPPPLMTDSGASHCLPGAGAVPPEITSQPVSQTIQLGQALRSP